jgi:hypothetical protein
VLAVAESLIAKHGARITAAVEAQRAAAQEAKKLGHDAAQLSDEARTVHMLHARYLGQPPAQRDAKAHAAELWSA